MSRLWRQLRWQIIGANMIVVIVGVSLVLIMSFILTVLIVPAGINAEIARATAGDAPEVAAAARAAILDELRGSILTTVLVAGAGAVIAGVLTSVYLARQLLRPLEEIAASSQRIANGRYDERVALPGSDELAGVATHFNQMAATLQQIEAQRVTLIGNVSHELRTPLTGLQGYLEGLQDGLFPANDETFRHIADEFARLRRLVDDLEALSRVEAGQVALDNVVFDPRPIVERVGAAMTRHAATKGVALRFAGEAGAADVRADPDRVAQVLVNLLSNAIRYSEAGDEIVVRLDHDQRFFRVAVEDEGVGIAAADLPYVFERFYRIDRSRARKSGGSGIGLTIARHLIWAMGGELTAASDGPGRGATFTFTLPRA